jgi:membrane dipeptidase
MPPPTPTDARLRHAAALHQDAVVIDGACPLISPREIKRYLPALRAGGVTCAVGTVASIEGARAALGQVAAWYPRVRAFPDDLVLAMTAADIEAAKRTGRVAVVLQFQGGNPLEYDANLVEAFYRLGVRIVQLTYNARNPLGDGCMERTDIGLSDLGVAVIAELNRLGMVLDLSHAGVRTSLEALEASRAPAIFSHSNARAVCDHPRNLTDEQLRLVARKGGVVGANAFPAFVRRDGAPTVEDLLDHVDYLVQVMGVDHVGLGLDFATENEDDYEYFGYKPEFYPRPPWIYPAGIDGFSAIPNVTRGLVERGYGDEDVRKIVGGNFLRVFRTVWGR